MVLDDIPHKVDQAVVQKIQVYAVIPTSTVDLLIMHSVIYSNLLYAL